MIRMLCENRTCQTELKGTGKEILEDALNAVHGIYSALYKNERMTAVLFAAMVKAEHEIIFNMDESELLEFTDRAKGIKEVVKPEDSEPEDKPLSVEEAVKRMDEMREEMMEITRKLLEE